MKRRVPIILTITALAGAATQAAGPSSDWPQWLGPTHDGASPVAGVFTGKSVTLRKAWRHEIGGGRSGLVVAGDTLFTLEADEHDEYALALDARYGREKWRVKLDPVDTSNGGPGSTPAAGAGRLFTVTKACQLRALEAATGKVAWTVDLKARFGNELRLGCLSSPFVEDGRLVVQAAGKDDHRVVGLDAATGELVWSFKGAERVSYASPSLPTSPGSDSSSSTTSGRAHLPRAGSPGSSSRMARRSGRRRSRRRRRGRHRWRCPTTACCS